MRHVEDDELLQYMDMLECSSSWAFGGTRSRARATRTLEERKLLQYMDMLLEFSTRKTLTLLERQQVAGRLRRAIMSMPPGGAASWQISSP